MFSKFIKNVTSYFKKKKDSKKQVNLDKIWNNLVVPCLNPKELSKYSYEELAEIREIFWPLGSNIDGLLYVNDLGHDKTLFIRYSFRDEIARTIVLTRVHQDKIDINSIYQKYLKDMTRMMKDVGYKNEDIKNVEESIDIFEGVSRWKKK